MVQLRLAVGTGHLFVVLEFALFDILEHLKKVLNNNHMISLSNEPSSSQYSVAGCISSTLSAVHLADSQCAAPQCGMALAEGRVECMESEDTQIVLG